MRCRGRRESHRVGARRGAENGAEDHLELKDKLAKEFASGEPLPDGVPSDGADDASDAVNALVVLGYSRAQALGALKGLDPALPLEIRIREALKKLY
ncbi:MAG: hypothetical protein ACLUFV_02375 [Acutalibacteraceae bacterium]